MITGVTHAQVVNYGIIAMIGDPALSVRYGAVMQSLEFILLTAILAIFRVQPLPQFYRVGLNKIGVS